jgi:hypothetical protein
MEIYGIYGTQQSSLAGIPTETPPTGSGKNKIQQGNWGVDFRRLSLFRSFELCISDLFRISDFVLWIFKEE